MIFSAAKAPIKNWPSANFSREPLQLRKSIGTNIKLEMILISLKNALTLKYLHKYSYLPNRRAGPNNQAGWKNSKKLINEQVRINEQVGIFLAL